MNLRPRQIVDELNKHIVGQSEAKIAVAIAMRNRWRRMQVPKPMGDEITPKNILMIGPTGVGKTEIARRLASLAQAPFIKVEATKFTEVGYVGRDVDTIVRDLAEVGVRQVRQQALQGVVSKAAEVAEERLLDLLLPQPEGAAAPTAATRERLGQKLRDGELDDRMVDVEVLAAPLQMEVLSPPGMEDMTGQLQSLFKNAMGGMRKTHKMPVSEARKVLAQEAASQLVNEDDIKRDAIRLVEQNGIVFLDEIDKIASRSELQGSMDVSRQGVQRDLLPLVEGTTVTTKYGPVNTDHILFIASGAFHLSKPSDLIPELQGRFPVRVELQPLTIADFEQILTRTDACLVAQYQALLDTEGVTLKFSDDGVRQLAELAYGVNERTMNIGARRLYAMMEKLLAQISFSAGEADGATVVSIDAAYVKEKLADLAVNEDLARYIL